MKKDLNMKFKREKKNVFFLKHLQKCLKQKKCNLNMPCMILLIICSTISSYFNVDLLYILIINSLIGFVS